MGQTLPRGRAIVRMRWQDLLFIHWPVPPEVVRPLVPKQLEIDTYDGTAWVGLIPFTMPVFRVYGLPIPTMAAFHECNVRTYVRCRGMKGVWFFSLDATSKLAVWGARRLWNLNYIHARIDIRHEGGVIDYSLKRMADPKVAMQCRWRPGDTLSQSKPGELAHFLTERYLLFAVRSSGELFRGPIHHEPWKLRRAELVSLEDDLVSAAGIPVDGDPILHHADMLDVRAWPLETMDATPGQARG